jgi:predicted phosphodiesterase
MVEELNGGKIKKPKYLHYATLRDMFPNISNDVKTVIVMSDMHSITRKIIDELIKRKLITKTTVVITCGDMSGSQKLGSNANPYDDYCKLQVSAMVLYFVQGNHDQEDERVYSLRNDDDTPCCVHNIVIDTVLGRIGGVNGIIGKDGNNHTFDEAKYQLFIDSVIEQSPQIFLSHMPGNTQGDTLGDTLGDTHFVGTTTPIISLRRPKSIS